MIQRRERVIITRHDGGVSFIEPMAECMAWMTGGGGYWANKPRGYADQQVERCIAAGHLPWAAKRFCGAMMRGGCTDAEAIEIITLRDAGHRGTGFEVIDVFDLPDLWFHDSFRRSPNGGPIAVDMRRARKLQLSRIATMAKERDIELKLDLWRSRIRKAQTPEWLKAVWPRGLSWEGVRP